MGQIAPRIMQIEPRVLTANRMKKAPGVPALSGDPKGT